MRTKKPTVATDDQTDQSIENGNRRASGRVRKLTAKAVALSGSRSYSPPISDTIVIGETLPSRQLSSDKEPSPVSLPPKIDLEQLRMLQEIPETPASIKANGVRTPSPEALAEDEAPAPVPETTPSRRQSLREKKPTSKILSESTTAQKRPATEDPDENTVRKSLRLSYSGAKVPSKLRYSVSSASSRAQEIDAFDTVEVAETPAAKKSKIITLKFKQPQLAVLQPALQPKPKPKDDSISYKGKSRRASERQKKTTKEITDEPKPRPRPVDGIGSCSLSCLSPSSRLLAFAQIALQMPDDDDEDGPVIPGSVHDWRMYTQTWCRCDQGQQARPERTNSAELARALMPNTVAQGSKQDPIDLSTSQTPESDLLSTPVNTILRASDAERLSQLYGPVPSSSSQSPNTLPPRAAKRPADDLSAPNGQPPQKRVMSESPHLFSSYQPPQSHASRRTFEDRLRDDYNALANIRQRAAARGISWTYNQTFEDIQAMIVKAEDREHQNQYRQQVINPPTVLGRAHEAAREPRPSPTGFGVLLPPKGSTFIQRNSNGPVQRNESPATTSSTNGSAGPSNESSKPSKINFVETDPANPAKARRPSTESRQKSSRFRVDPRGLRGEAPGPGTIINMQDLKKKAEGLRRLGKAMREFEAKQKIMRAREHEARMLQQEKWAKERAEKEAAEAAAANVDGDDQA